MLQRLELSFCRAAGVFAMLLFSSVTAGAATKGDPKKGEAVFKTNCVACHGEKGDGTGPAGAALNPKPANFTDSQRMKDRTDERLFKTVKEGGASVGLSPMMVAWGSILSDEQIHDVVAYIRTTFIK